MWRWASSLLGRWPGRTPPAAPRGARPAGPAAAGEAVADPLLREALRLAGRPSPAGAWNTERLAQRLAAAQSARHATLDAGLWGWPIFRATAAAALRARATAVTGDESA